MNDLQQARVRWAVVIVLVAVMVLTRVNAQDGHWSEGPAELAVCDALIDTEGYAAASYCAVRYQAAAAGTWTDSMGPEFAGALPVLGLFLAVGLGYSLGSGLVPR